ncbi:MAG: FGGY-family carbohydrate kinase [Microthrixaceae bacterium]|nr:FGGY-family carbohydrate kinase [Microthrixaceae bacterium]
MTDPGEVPLWLPFIRGERVPLHDPSRRAELHDAHLVHGPEHMLRAVYESSGFVIRRHLELAGLLDGTGPTTARRVVVSGGGSRDDHWVQAIADVTGLPVECTAISEGAALGAAYLGRVALGLEAGTEGAGRWARSGRRFEPDAAWGRPASVATGGSWSSAVRRTRAGSRRSRGNSRCEQETPDQPGGGSARFSVARNQHLDARRRGGPHERSASDRRCHRHDGRGGLAGVELRRGPLPAALDLGRRQVGHPLHRLLPGQLPHACLPA